MKKITIFSTPTCIYCTMAKSWLTEKNIPYTEYNVASDLEKRKEMIEKTGQMGVPVILVDDPSNSSGQAEVVVGFNRPRLEQLLGI